MILVILKTKIVINSGNSYFNFLGLVRNAQIIKISLQHGQGPKTDYHCKKQSRITDILIKSIHQFDYINFPSEFTSELNGRSLYKLPDEKIITFGYPKNDNLMNVYNKKKLRVNASNQLCELENNIKTLLKDIKIKNERIILYTPTWRPYKSSGFELSLLSGYNERNFSKYLEDNNLFLIFSSHPIMNNNKNNDKRIINVSNHKSLLDINDIMIYADILLNDYSTTSIDFSITNKPQLFCLPDHNKYISHVMLEKNYLNNLPGNYIFNYDDLILALNNILSDSNKYAKSFVTQRKDYLNKYYDCNNLDSCEKFNQFINTKC